MPSRSPVGHLLSLCRSRSTLTTPIHQLGKEANPRPLKSGDVGCERCPLYKRSNTVCCESDGPVKAPVFLVGEALGENEDREGVPFIGDAGMKLNYLLRRAGLKRKEVRIGNSARCRPPGNKTPNKSQLVACYPYLLHDILEGKPKVIVAMGAAATHALFGQARELYSWRGFPERRTFRYETKKGKVYEHTCWVIATYHPAGCLRDWRYDDLAVFDLQLAKHYARGREILKWPGTKTKVYRTLKGVLGLIRKLKSLDKFASDTENTGLSPHAPTRRLCIGFCWKDDEAHVIPLLGQHGRQIWTPAEKVQILDALTDLFDPEDEEDRPCIVGQNWKYDTNQLRAELGVMKFNVVCDTMLAHHVVDENKPHSLTFLTQWYLRWQKYDAALKQYLSQEHGFLNAPDQLLWDYLGHDCNGCWQVHKKLLPLVDEEEVQLPFKLEHDLIEPLADAEYCGITFDMERCKQLSLRYRTLAAKSRKYLVDVAERLLGDDYDKVAKDGVFNPNSHQQLAKLLVVANPKGMKRKTASGNISTDKTALGALALKKNTAGRIARHVMELRKYEKRVSTYLDGGDGGFARWVGTLDRIHVNHNIHKTRTGRLSVDDPPIQTVPRGGSMRSMFIPDSPKHIMLAVDYKKMELVIMAYLANDKTMIRELRRGDDLHTRMAITTQLGRDPTPEEFKRLTPTVSKDDRAVAKASNFGIPYGRGDAAIADTNPDAFPIHMKRQERILRVSKVTRAWAAKYHGCWDYLLEQDDLARNQGWLRTLFYERKRRLSGTRWMNSRYAEECEKNDMELGHVGREGRNFQIQSIASDTLTKTTRICYDGIRRVKLPGFRIAVTMHDALIFMVQRPYVDEAEALIHKWMTVKLPKDKVHRYEMNLEVDVLRQEFWGAEYMEDDEKEQYMRAFEARRRHGTPLLTIAERHAYADATERWTRRVRRTVV